MIQTALETFTYFRFESPRHTFSGGSIKLIQKKLFYFSRESEEEKSKSIIFLWVEGQ